MFQSLIETSRNSQFCFPFHVRCEAPQGETQLMDLKSNPIAGRNVSAAAAADGTVEFGTMKYYALCGFRGILSCGITHTAVVPLDLVKCRIQISSSPGVEFE